MIPVLVRAGSPGTAHRAVSRLLILRQPACGAVTNAGWRRTSLDKAMTQRAHPCSDGHCFGPGSWVA